MKVFLIFFLFINSLFAIDALSLRQALKQPSEKPIFIFVESEGCPYCKKAKEQMNDNFLSYVKENFRFVIVNQTYDYMPNNLISKMTPAYYIINDDLEHIINPMYGIQDNPVILKELNKVLYKK